MLFYAHFYSYDRRVGGQEMQVRRSGVSSEMVRRHK